MGPGERRLTEPTTAVRRWQWDRRHDRRLLTYALASRLEGELDGSEGHEGGENLRQGPRNPWQDAGCA